MIFIIFSIVQNHSLQSIEIILITAKRNPMGTGSSYLSSFYFVCKSGGKVIRLLWIMWWMRRETATVNKFENSTQIFWQNNVSKFNESCFKSLQKHSLWEKGADFWQIIPSTTLFFGKFYENIYYFWLNNVLLAIHP